MLKIVVPPALQFDEETNEFHETKEITLTLEHSLVSISKWEAKWGIPFLSSIHEKTEEMYLDYIRCMTLTQNVDPRVYYSLSAENRDSISKYIEAPMTATWFKDTKGHSGNKRIVTSELIYCWMIGLQIPVEFQKWHINRLLTLIRVCNEENAAANNPKKNKMSRTDVAQRNKLNAARRKARNSKG